ncbi:hypothetical protein PIB30_116486, partial [Stylosanthes scabra]|nr:hypothetical protein [Stylosanthes scabra]
MAWCMLAPCTPAMGNNPSCYAQDQGLDRGLSTMWEGRVAWAHPRGATLRARPNAGLVLARAR